MRDITKRKKERLLKKLTRRLAFLKQRLVRWQNYRFSAFGRELGVKPDTPCVLYVRHNRRKLLRACVGPKPKHRGRLCICHACDDRRCVHPEHLFWGTCSDNTRDAVLKRRFVGKHIPDLEKKVRQTEAKIATTFDRIVKLVVALEQGDSYDRMRIRDGERRPWQEG